MYNELISLFVAFLKVGSFSFGGAYSLLPLIETEIVKNHQWLTQDEFLKVLGMVEIIPGAISIKFATYTGYKVAGVPGILVANFANMITPIALILVMTFVYTHFEKNVYVAKLFEGIKFVILGIIASILIKYSANQFSSYKDIFFILAGLTAAYFLKVNPIFIILGGGILSLIIL